MVLKQMLLNQLKDLVRLAQINRQNGDVKQAEIYEEYIAAIEAEFQMESTVIPQNFADNLSGQEKVSAIVV